jgi:type IV pilus assembly protein PilY1
MRNRFRSHRLAAFTARKLVAAATVITAVAVPRLAAAQSAGPDTATASPNVMLLLDTSSSMELKASGTGLPACVPGTPNTGSPTDQNEKSRWINLMEVLSGSIENYSCFAESKSSPDFKQEYSLGPSQVLPRDYKDSDDYHRPLSNGCAPGPGDLPAGAPWGWPASPLSAVKYRPYAGGTIAAASTCAAGTWSQANNGLLSGFDGLLRFGLMTFDTEADPGTGVSGPDLTYGLVDGTADYRNGVRGAWSYYLPANAGCRHPATSATQCQTAYPDGTVQDDQAGCCMGGPINCTVLSPLEVGARNAAAPPWEGRMVAFGPSSEDGTKRIDWIEDVVRSTRPFGATPIAGMLSDARDFFWNDDSLDPLDKATGEKFGPAKDPQVQNSCRQNYIVLLTDGEPNMDLRTPCEGVATDKCPFDRSDEIVADLANSTSPAKKPVRTFVVGFALDQANVNGVPTDCRTLDPTSPACANPTDQALRTCCTLNSIAFNGTPTALQSDTTVGAIKYALFPQSAQDLRTALSEVFTAANRVPSASRTYPVTVTAALSDPTLIGGVKIAGYEITSGGRPAAGWGGILSRQRIVCDGNQIPTPAQIEKDKGDDFIATVNNSPLTRTMFTVEPPASAVGWDPTHSIRPYFTDATLDDGVHFGDGVQSDFKDPTGMKNVISVQAMKGVTAATCGTASAATCKDRIVDYMVGVPSASPLSRCGPSGCNVVGDIFHSVPQVVNGIPSEFLRDPTYTKFSADLATRDSMVYTSTNDGFFHGFWLTPGDRLPQRVVDNLIHQNESWAFVPPAVLPYFASMYPTAGATATRLRSLPVNRIPALDGVPVIRDVGATKDGTRALNNSAATNQYYPYRLERKKAPASGETHTWRTVMTQAFGPLQGGFFALDVTQPLMDKTGSDKSIGPRFLWQLTTDTAGKQIFGSGSPTPLITTLFVDLKNLGGPSTSDPPLEVPVAVLPGGRGGPAAPPTPGCGNPGTFVTQDGITSTPGRSSIRCYRGNDDSYAARSLTIVRLDNGQILRTFRPILTAPAVQPVTFDPKVLTLVDIQAPIVGQPAAFPSQAGQVADRIFVGDAEGRIWRVDVSKPDPADWTMQPFFDAFYDLAPTALAPPQPVQTPPVLSVDDKGQITVAFSTGDQDNVTPDANHLNYVVSVTETVFPALSGNREFHAQMNWRKQLTGGAHVLGPMSLFDRTLYYSTFLQPSGSKTCEMGDSTIVGVDYINALDATPETTGGAVKVPPVVVTSAVVSGVALRQQPACAATTAAQGSTDDFLGYGQTTAVSTVNPGVFELVVQKSGSTSTTAGTGISVPTLKAPIPVPRLQVRVDSWAPIIE